MFKALASLANRYPRQVLLVGAIIAILAGLFGSSVASRLSTGGFTVHSSQSDMAAVQIQKASGGSLDMRVVAVVSTPKGALSPSGKRVINGVAKTFRASKQVTQVLVPINKGVANPLMLAENHKSAVVIAILNAHTLGSAIDDAGSFVKAFVNNHAVLLGGTAVMGYQSEQQVSTDITHAETLAFPILFVLLLLIFRNLIGALLPLICGGLAILLSMSELRFTNSITPLSIYALNITTSLGLGLAIDYSLLFVGRYREELGKDTQADVALQRTIKAAGSTVIFSALTVIVALASLLIFPLGFLSSMGIGGMLVVFTGGVIALVLLPSLLSLFGGHLQPWWGKDHRAGTKDLARASTEPVTGGWYRLSKGIMRHAGLIAVSTIVVILLLASPFLNIRFTGWGFNVLPSTFSAKKVDGILPKYYPTLASSPIFIALDAPDNVKGRLEVNNFAKTVHDLPSKPTVQPPALLKGSVWSMGVKPKESTFSTSAQNLVHQIRDIVSPVHAKVGGLTAGFVDERSGLISHLPLAIIIAGLATILILFGMTGSVILPVKAVIMNLASISAAFGILVWVFQDGRFQHFLSYVTPRALDATQPYLLAAIAFGLSTDYGVFLLSRITQEHILGLDTKEAVAKGLERTGRIVTAAALLLSVTLFAFATSKILPIKELGIGAALAVLIDASIVRVFLVPSLMALLGRWNWWAPKPLARIHKALGFTHPD